MRSSVQDLPLIIDTDMGPDDWIALLFLAISSKFSIRAVSISGTGEMHGKKGAFNCLKLLSLKLPESKLQKLPIGYGPSKPLQGHRRFPFIMRWLMDHFMFLKMPSRPITLPTPTSDSLSLLYENLKEAVDPLPILAIGPLTNLALLFRHDHHISKKISQLVIMGGALRVEGNIHEIRPLSKNHTAEWNFYCDPQAVSEVFQQKIPITIVPLDATNQVYIDQAFMDRLYSLSDHPIVQFIYKTLKRLKSRVETNRYFLWDVCAAALLLEPSIGTYEKFPLSVIKQDPNAGQIIIDHSSGSSIQVCTSIDRAQFTDIFFDALTSLK